MGGQGSGGWNRLSDDEKKRRGTFRADYSDANWDAKQAAKIITGPWLSEIPAASLPLGDAGKAKYDELTKLLFEQNKLTKVTCTMCEQVAVLYQKQHNMLSAGKDPPVSLVTRISGLLDRLRIAENAPTIASPGAKNKFAGSGFSNSRVSPLRLRPYRAAGSGEL